MLKNVYQGMSKHQFNIWNNDESTVACIYFYKDIKKDQQGLHTKTITMVSSGEVENN